MPSRARQQAEAVARGRCRSDAPTRGCRARFQKLCLSQQEQRQAGIHGGEMQPLAQFQIELVDHAGDGGRRTRTQRLFEGPQSFLAMRGFDQDQTSRVEAKTMAAVTMRTAIFAQPIGRHDKQERTILRQAGKQRHDEPESRRDAAFFRHDFMQGPADKATPRQAPIDGGKAEGEGPAGRKPFHFGQ